MARKGNDNGFIQEYLYIEEYPLNIIKFNYTKESKHKSDEPKRGVLVIDLLGNEEQEI